MSENVVEEVRSGLERLLRQIKDLQESQQFQELSRSHGIPSNALDAAAVEASKFLSVLLAGNWKYRSPDYQSEFYESVKKTWEDMASIRNMVEQLSEGIMLLQQRNNSLN